MPIYEYRCSSCGHELEALQKFSDAPLTTCPSCNAVSLVKLMSAAGFQLKGSGWYATDFKTSGARPAPPKVDGESKSDAKTEDKGETTTKTDAKTDAKSATKTEGKGESKSEPKTESKGSGTPPPSGTGTPPATT